jgi:hypothetical protein
MTEAPWLRLTDIPPPRTEAKLLAFFGIPPDGLDQLDSNIARKRRVWHHKRSGVSPQGRTRAEAVLALVHSGSQALLRGAATDDVVGGAAQATVDEALDLTLENLWSIIDDLLANDEYERALRVAADARRRWPDAARPSAAYAWVVWAGWQADFFIRTPLLEEGVELAARALGHGAEDPRSPERVATWDTRIGLLLALEHPRKALDATRDAEAALVTLPSRLRAHRAEGLLMSGRPDEGMVEAVQAVVGARGDRALLAALRGRCTTMLVRRLVEGLTPVTSNEGLYRYVEAVNVAAWCARGVPEAEELIRAHRLWAAQANQRVFAGSWELRSFFAVCTGFASLVPHNRARSQPAWQIYAKGPKDGGMTWKLIAETGFVKSAHRAAESRLPWSQ